MLTAVSHLKWLTSFNEHLAITSLRSGFLFFPLTRYLLNITSHHNRSYSAMFVSVSKETGRKGRGLDAPRDAYQLNFHVRPPAAGKLVIMDALVFCSHKCILLFIVPSKVYSKRAILMTVCRFNHNVCQNYPYIT